MAEKEVFDWRLSAPGAYIDRSNQVRVYRETLRRNPWIPRSPFVEQGTDAAWQARGNAFLNLWGASRTVASIDSLDDFVLGIAWEIFPEYDLPIVSRMHPSAAGPSIDQLTMFMTLPELPENYLTGVTRDVERAVSTAARTALEAPEEFLYSPIVAVAEMLGTLLYETSLVNLVRYVEPVGNPRGLSPSQAADTSAYRDAYFTVAGSHLGLFALIERGAEKPLSPSVLMPYLQQRTQAEINMLDTDFVIPVTTDPDGYETGAVLDEEQREHVAQMYDLAAMSKALRQDMLHAGSMYPRSGRRRVEYVAENLYGRMPSELRREELETVESPIGLPERLGLPLRQL